MQKPIVVTTFYKFVRLPDYRELKDPLLDLCTSNGVRGTILLAEEGINATIAGTRDGIDNVMDSLCDDSRFADLVTKESYTDELPFQRTKVRLKNEIVALKVDGINPNDGVGQYVEPNEWNDLISRDDVVVIDTRNDYEVQIGTFKRALNPNTEAFNDFPDYVADNLNPNQHKKVAMFCTGGIRCEKATAFMLKQGFEEVYHLNGGILRYLEHVDPEDSLWEGECFVFDERVSVDHHLQKGKVRICDDCKSMVTDLDQPCPNCGSSNFL